MKEIERMLKALASRPRLKILQHLKIHKTATVTEISAALKLAPATVSRHLLRLAMVDIVVSIRRSRFVFYRLRLPQDPLVKLVLERI